MVHFTESRRSLGGSSSAPARHRSIRIDDRRDSRDIEILALTNIVLKITAYYAVALGHATLAVVSPVHTQTENGFFGSSVNQIFGNYIYDFAVTRQLIFKPGR